jgi:epsilon-lactone hydrolase
MTETISNLMEANLRGVFNERDARRRAAMIKATYSSDVRWTDDEGTTVGREALDAKATALQSQMQGLVFTKAGPVYETRGLGYLAWELGPDGGEPVACGFDVAVVRNEVISELYTVITDSRPGNTQSPAAATDDGDGPSQLLQAFIAYLRARPAGADPESAKFVGGASELEGVTRRSSELGGVPVIMLQPQVGSPGRTVLYFHGGGYVTGSPPDRYLPLAAAVALAANAQVFVVDYRLAPQTPFPGAFDDCLRAYHWLVTYNDSDPRTLALLGDSAGGNLAVAVTAAARDQRLALPDRIALLSPLADLTFSGASIEQRKHLDPLVTREMLESTSTDYLAGADPRDPRCSAIFADMHGFPSMLIQVGENEILYDDATRIRDAATAAGVKVSFESWRHGIHVWPVFISAGLPESSAAIERLAAFFKT